MSASSQHTGGVNLLLASGSVQFTTESIDLETWRKLGEVHSGNRTATFSP